GRKAATRREGLETNFVPSKTGSPSQDRHRCQADEKHPEFHRETGDDERAVRFQRSECVTRDPFHRNMNEPWAAFGLFARASCDLLEFGVHRTGAESAHAHACFTEFSAERFGEAGHIRLGRSVNSKSGNWQETGR